MGPQPDTHNDYQWDLMGNVSQVHIPFGPFSLSLFHGTCVHSLNHTIFKQTNSRWN